MSHRPLKVWKKAGYIHLRIWVLIITTALSSGKLSSIIYEEVCEDGSIILSVEVDVGHITQWFKSPVPDDEDQYVFIDGSTAALEITISNAQASDEM